jgi:membrane-bound serine protease (ClpP class)
MLLLVGAGIVLLVGELLLPTHGVLGIGGLAALLGAVAVCFYINRWMGLGIFVLALIASPFVWMFMISVWLKTPVGKRIVLPPIAAQRPVLTLRLGDVGSAVTELRPMGECEFGGERFEVISERGIIPAGAPVKIVAMGEGKPIVRLAQA